jgi:DNA-binding beta-propeller fold protein YncE
MYIVGTFKKTVYQYTLNTAWDVSTASYASKSFSVAGQETNPKSVFFNPDGTKMYIVGATNDTIYQYTLIAENLCLISVVESALSTPESGYIALQMEEVTPSIILNTDLVVAISRDGGTTFTDGTLSLAANIETQKILVANLVGLSSQPSGTSMVSKISLLNSKQAKIHGICMEWR